MPDNEMSQLHIIEDGIPYNFDNPQEGMTDEQIELFERIYKEVIKD